MIQISGTLVVIRSKNWGMSVSKANEEVDALAARGFWSTQTRNPDIPILTETVMCCSMR